MCSKLIVPTRENWFAKDVITLPKIIHQTWKTKDVPSKWKSYHQTWKTHFPENSYKHILWTDEMNRDLIVKHFPWFLSVYDNYPKNIQRVDAVRPFILFKYGGIYADLDYECRENFYHLLDPKKLNIVESPYHHEHFQNALLASTPFHPSLKRIIQELMNRKDILSTLQSTGPGIYDCLKDDLSVHSLPVETFNPPHYYFLYTSLVGLSPPFNPKIWNSAMCRHHPSLSWGPEEMKTWVSHHTTNTMKNPAGKWIGIVLLLLLLCWLINRR